MTTTTNKSLSKLLKAYNRTSTRFVTVETLASATKYSETRVQKIVSLNPELFSRVVSANKSLGKVLNSFTYKSGYATVSHIVRKTKYSPERVQKVLETNPSLFGKSLIKKSGTENFYMLKSEVSTVQDIWNTLVNLGTGRY
jgi:hypothetical protein